MAQVHNDTALHTYLRLIPKASHRMLHKATTTPHIRAMLIITGMERGGSRRNDGRLVRALAYNEGSWNVCCQQPMSVVQAMSAAVCQCVLVSVGVSRQAAGGVWQQAAGGCFYTRPGWRVDPEVVLLQMTVGFKQPTSSYCLIGRLNFFSKNIVLIAHSKGIS